MDIQKASSLEKKAETAYHARDYRQAADLYRQAAGAYDQAEDRQKYAELANNLSVALLQAGDPQAALEATQGTERIFAEAGNLRSQALALGNQASALEALNRLQEALFHFRLCSDLLKQAGDEENRAYVLKKISSIQVRTGHQLEALASMDAALSHKQKLSFKERFLKKLLHIPMDMLNRGK